MLNFGETSPSEAGSTDLELEAADNQIEEV